MLVNTAKSEATGLALCLKCTYIKRGSFKKLTVAELLKLLKKCKALRFKLFSWTGVPAVQKFDFNFFRNVRLQNTELEADMVDSELKCVDHEPGIMIDWGSGLWGGSWCKPYAETHVRKQGTRLWITRCTPSGRTKTMWTSDRTEGCCAVLLCCVTALVALVQAAPKLAACMQAEG